MAHHRKQTPGAARRRRQAAALVLGWAASACGSLVDPPLPSGAVAFTPPPVYARWWAMTEACSGRTRDLNELSWYVVPMASAFPNGSAGEANGYYSDPGGRIVLAGLSQLDGTVVRHEMLHALLRGVHGHPRAEFLAHCAGLVACGPACVSDAGPAPTPPAGTPVVPPSALQVSAELAPTITSVAGSGAWYALTVTATNPNRTAVVVAAPVYNTGFGYRFVRGGVADPAVDVTGAYGTEVPVYDAAARQFAAGEAKRYVFDFHVLQHPDLVPDAGESRLPEGRYVVRGAFGGLGVGPWSPAVAVTVAP